MGKPEFSTKSPEDSLESTKPQAPLSIPHSSPTRLTKTHNNLLKETRSLTFHLYTIWLFTASDLISVVLPETLLGLSCALSGSLLTSNRSPKLLDVLARTPQIAVWNWLNLFLFDINNQFQPGSIIEDSHNKAWRAIPSQRLTEREARRLLLFVIPTVYAATLYLGGTREAVQLMIMTWMYNDLGGADDSILTRNLLNAFGYMCYSSGSMKIAAGHGLYELNERAEWWLWIIGGVIFTTLQMQDMPDVEGDAARGRRTVPLVWGDGQARWSIVVPVAVWSVICPMVLELNWVGYIFPVAVGSLFVGRLLMVRGVMADRRTWKLWCLWMTMLYLLPVCKEHGALI